MSGSWKQTACILCECNCGLEVQLGGENDRHFVRIRGDKAHPASKGYACEKPHRLDYYQNDAGRLTKPLRRREDGSFEEVDWDTAIREGAERFAAIRDEHGGDKILYYGGGGQGNHLPAGYSRSTRAARTLDSVVAVALRVDLLIIAISPKMPPSSSAPRGSPRSVTSTSPARITYM